LGQLHENIVVKIAPGEYYSTEIVFNQEDSPTVKGKRVIWEGGGEAKVFGGGRIEGWEHYRHGIWRAKLPRELVDNEVRCLTIEDYRVRIIGLGLA